MKTRICRDCGQIISDENLFSKKSDICKQCYTRKQNMKSRGKEYIRIVDLPEDERNKIIESRERNKKVGRKKKDKSNKNNKNNQKNLVKASNSLSEELEKDRQLVLEDITNCIKNSKSKVPTDFISIVPVFNQLHTIFTEYENYIKNMINVEDIVNKIEIDYRHAKEHFASLLLDGNLSLDEYNMIYEKKEIWEHRHNILLDYRRDIKNVLTEYKTAGNFFIELSNNKELMNIFNDYYNQLNKANEMIVTGSYKANVSSLVEHEDFCVGYKPNVRQKSRYNVTIRTLYGGTYSTFNRIAIAYTPEEAKQQVENFIKSRPNQFRFSWKDEDTRVTLLDNKENPQQ